MNFRILQPILKSFLPQLIESLDSVNHAVKMQLENVVLPKNAVYAAYCCLCNDTGVAYISLCTFDADDKMVSVENSQKLTDFIQSLLKML
ncbi:MAG: hypothetical protein LBB41_06330 [Prevotellaceae bacterium]|nr:hypothetical protein [Prevotellaceae bacterium]